MPDCHTDPAFSRTLLDLRSRLRVFPVAVAWDEKLRLRDEVKPLAILWAHLRRQIDDRGRYLRVMRIDRPKREAIGSLGEIRFEPGYYVDVGSAMQNLTARVARHLRQRNTRPWHVDHLRRHADEVVPLPIRSPERRECRLAGAFGPLLAPVVPGFGSSDCRCGTDLFRSRDHPFGSRAFHDLLPRFRMRPPGATHCGVVYTGRLASTQSKS